MNLAKRILNLFLCFVLSSTQVWAKETQYSFNFPEPTPKEARQIVEMADDAFQKGGLTRYLLNKAAKGSKIFDEKIAPKAIKLGGATGRFAIHGAQSAAIGALQGAVIGSASILAMAVAVDCNQKKILNQDDCLNTGVVSDNFEIAAKFLLSSGEFYAAGAGGAITMAPVGLATKYLVQNSVANNFFKLSTITAATAILLHFGSTFLMQLYRLSEHSLTEKEKALAHGLIPRLVSNRISGATGQIKMNEQDELLFQKIVGNMNHILYEAPELRAMVIDQWWRLEVASGRGIVTVATMLPAFYYMLKGMISGSKAGMAMGMLIGGAFGLLGGVTMALLPEEYLREVSLVSQGLRTFTESSRLNVNESELRRLLSYFQKDLAVEKIVGTLPGIERKNTEREIEFKNYLGQRKSLRNAFGTIVYEKVYDAQNLINETERNMHIARGVLADEELLSALTKALSVNSEGKFTYGEENGPGIKLTIKDTKLQKEILSKGPYYINDLRIFIAGEIKRFYSFYQKEEKYLSDLNQRSSGYAPASLFLELENEKATVALLRDKNRDVLFGVLADIDPTQCYEISNKRHRIEYAKASSDFISLFRTYAYSENTLLDLSAKKN